MNQLIISPKALIEVALPLDSINTAAKEEKAVPRRGHPQTLHYWWARRPLAAARAVIFSQLVHDPEDLWRCQNPGKDPNSQVKGHWTKSRARLFAIIEELVKWENTSNQDILEKAREEIRKSWRETCELNKNHPQASELFNPDKIPSLHDPFAGGGTIPLEAQRLGLNAHASDLNPVAVLINKAMIEIPPKFAGSPPFNPKSHEEKLLINREWNGSEGLAEDVRYYGQLILNEARKRIGTSYPTIKITKDLTKDRPDLQPFIGKELNVVAWLWARTVKSPNPAFSHVDVPLVSTFILSNKSGKDTYVDPIIDGNSYKFIVKVGTPPASAKSGTSAGQRQAFRCLVSNTPISYAYIRDEGQAGRMGTKLIGIVAEGPSGRVYISPVQEHEENPWVKQQWIPETIIVPGMSERVVGYGLRTYSDIFTRRQLEMLTTFSDLVSSTRATVRNDAVAAGLSDDNFGIEAGGTGATAYADAIATYLSCALSRLASYNNTICFWNMKGGSVAFIFARQAISMSWDFIEINPLQDMSGNWSGAIEWVSDVLGNLNAGPPASVQQADATTQKISKNKVISTDPPYFDNIGYADLSDFFYVWLRRTLRSVYPELMATISVPKAEELIADHNRHGSRNDAELFFLKGMTHAMQSLAGQSHPAVPITIYYAFKQSETEGEEGTSSSGWETFLEAVNRAGFTLTGTWPMRTERNSGVKVGRNVLASCIVLVCRPRQPDARTISRRQFIRELNETLPVALDTMTRESEGLHSPVAPVDLSQAIIGPGISCYSKYAAVLEADGSPMTVRTALQLINRFLAEDDFDADTQFCLHWFEQYGWETGKFGEADTLARAKGTSVEGVKQAGVLHAVGGNVRLLKWAEYQSDWDPKSDPRLPIWEVLHQLIRVFNTDGETGAAAVFAAVQSKAEAARQLAYRLYTLCERKNWAEDARAYNEVVTSWSGIESAAAKETSLTQRSLFDN